MFKLSFIKVYEFTEQVNDLKKRLVSDNHSDKDIIKINKYFFY